MRLQLMRFTFGLWLILLGCAVAQTGAVQLDVKKHTLKNGMRILVVENPSSPVFSTIIRFNTGSVDEHPGITGSSHLLEHMLFKGTKIIGTSNYAAEVPLMKQIDSLAHLMYAEQAFVAAHQGAPDSTKYKALRQQIAGVQAQQKKYVIKDELWSTYLQNGGTGLNASTGNDGTQYFVSLPKNRLELWMFLESDRLANLVLREFYSERDVVMEERRLSTENQVRGRLDEASSAATFWASPYGWPVVGWMSDLMTLQREDVEAYFKSHYAPSNAVAAIVGDVKAEEVFALCDKYFGAIPAQPMPKPVVTVDAPHMGERRVEVEYDANPSAFITWATPASGHPDLPALQVAATLLSNGRTSRFYHAIREKKLGMASADVDYARYPSTFYCQITPFGAHTVPELEEAVYAEIDRLKAEPVTDWELQKVRNQIDAQFTRSLESNNMLASRLASSESMTGDWHTILQRNEAVKKVTADDIMRVVNKYLVKRNRTVTFITKTGAPKDRVADQPTPAAVGRPN